MVEKDSRRVTEHRMMLALFEDIASNLKDHKDDGTQMGFQLHVIREIVNLMIAKVTEEQK